MWAHKHVCSVGACGFRISITRKEVQRLRREDKVASGWVYCLSFTPPGNVWVSSTLCTQEIRCSYLPGSDSTASCKITPRALSSPIQVNGSCRIKL